MGLGVGNVTQGRLFNITQMAGHTHQHTKRLHPYHAQIFAKYFADNLIPDISWSDPVGHGDLKGTLLTS